MKVIIDYLHGDPGNSHAHIPAIANHPPFSHHCHRSRVETRCDRVVNASNFPSMRPIAIRISSRVFMYVVLLVKSGTDTIGVGVPAGSKEAAAKRERDSAKHKSK